MTSLTQAAPRLKREILNNGKESGDTRIGGHQNRRIGDTILISP